MGPRGSWPVTPPPAEIIEAADRGELVDRSELAAANERLRSACGMEDGEG